MKWEHNKIILSSMFYYGIIGGRILKKGGVYHEEAYPAHCKQTVSVFSVNMRLWPQDLLFTPLCDPFPWVWVNCDLLLAIENLVKVTMYGGYGFGT